MDKLDNVALGKKGMVTARIFSAPSELTFDMINTWKWRATLTLKGPPHMGRYLYNSGPKYPCGPRKY